MNVREADAASGKERAPHGGPWLRHHGNKCTLLSYEGLMLREYVCVYLFERVCVCVCFSE